MKKILAMILALVMVVGAVFTMSSCNGQVHYAKFQLKSPNERLNVQKLYFPDISCFYI